MGEKHEKESKANAGEKKSDGGVSTVILGFDMHCKGCAKKITKSVQKFPGVESVKADCSAGKLIVTGKIDAVKIKEKVEEKMRKTVELVSSQTNKAAAKEGGGNGGGEKKSDDKKPEEKKSEGKSDDKNKSEGKSDDKNKSEGKSGEKKKSEESKKSDECKKCDDKKKSETKEKEKPKEPPVAIVVLKTMVHCEGCAQKIKKIVSKCEGVKDVNVDLQKDQITIKGSMNMKELLPYLNTKLKRTVELAESKKDESSGNKDKKKSKEDDKAPEKPKQSTDKSEKPKTPGGEKKETGGEQKDGEEKKKEGGGEKKKGDKNSEAAPSKDNSNSTKIAINKMEYNPYGYDNGYSSYTYDPRQEDGEGYGHQVVEYWHGQEYSQPPQLFSDENPNACSIM